MLEEVFVSGSQLKCFPSLTRGSSDCTALDDSHLTSGVVFRDHTTVEYVPAEKKADFKKGNQN